MRRLRRYDNLVCFCVVVSSFGLSLKPKADDGCPRPLKMSPHDILLEVETPKSSRCICARPLLG